MTTYEEFVAAKRRAPMADPVPLSGDIHPALYPFQREIVARALTRGRCALFEDCGLGKSIQSLEWSRHVAAHTGRPVMLVTPLAVGPQMVDEARRIGVDVDLVRRPNGLSAEVACTNYEMLHHFDPSLFGGLVLDESGILKNHLGSVRRMLVDWASGVPYRLAATATPAPNDIMELLNHAEYLGLMSVKEALALWFTRRDQVQKWVLKGHAEQDFWRWVGMWAFAIRSPSDAGFPMEGYDSVPEPETTDHVFDFDHEANGDLFPHVAGISEARRVRRETLAERVRLCAELVNRDAGEPWIVWCDLNDESSALVKAMPGAVEIRGSDSAEAKTDALTAFSAGRVRVLVTKPSIAGHGLNWQHCARMAFVGLGYSYEAYYQAVRRCWRYGQRRAVEIHRFYSRPERIVAETLERKEEHLTTLYDRIPWQIDSMKAESAASPETKTSTGRDWTLHLGDSVETIAALEDESVGLSVFSPPFPGMYVYTDSPHDMGNVASIGQMVAQFRHLAQRMLRVMIPGRSVFIHITQGVAQLGRDGYVGLKDFRGALIAMMDSLGWVYYGEVTIDKNPQIKAIRTKDAGLMFKSLATDAARMHPALSDTLLQFRKPGENPVPIKAGQSERYGNMAGWVTPEDWILWARPVWYADDYQPRDSSGEGIRETDVLNVAAARSDKDERHLCPLQLGVIRRCVRVWSSPDELVYSPFAGIGSEGVVALQEGRRFVGGELKPEYFDAAVANLDLASGELRLYS